MQKEQEQEQEQEEQQQEESARSMLNAKRGAKISSTSQQMSRNMWKVACIRVNDGVVELNLGDSMAANGQQSIFAGARVR